MDDVRALGPRLARLVVSLADGVAGAFAICAAFPHQGQSLVFCPLAIFVALACGLAVGCFAVLAALRRRLPRIAAPLPVARSRSRK